LLLGVFKTDQFSGGDIAFAIGRALGA